MTVTAPTDCCATGRWHGLFLPENVGDIRGSDHHKSCRRHMTNAERDLSDKVMRHGESMGIGPDDWPYGPNISLPTRVRMLDWMKANDLRLAVTPKHMCTRWLRHGICRRLRSCDESLQGEIAGGYSFEHERWQDHVTYWTRARDGRPAAIVAQPYMSVDDATRATHHLRERDVHVDVSSRSWYGHGTVLIEVYDARYTRST